MTFYFLTCLLELFTKLKIKITILSHWSHVGMETGPCSFRGLRRQSGAVFVPILALPTWCASLAFRCVRRAVLQAVLALPFGTLSFVPTPLAMPSFSFDGLSSRSNTNIHSTDDSRRWGSGGHRSWRRVQCWVWCDQRDGDL